MGRQGRKLVIALAASLQCVEPTPAQDWPTRPVTMVVPFGAGGASDVMARIVAEGLRATLGQPVI